MYHPFSHHNEPKERKKGSSLEIPFQVAIAPCDNQSKANNNSMEKGVYSRGNCQNHLAEHQVKHFLLSTEVFLIYIYILNH